MITLTLTALVLCFIYPVFLLFQQKYIGILIILPDRHTLFYPEPFITDIIIVSGLILGISSLLLYRYIIKHKDTADNSFEFLQIMYPFSYLPLIILPLFFRRYFHHIIAINFFFYGSIFVISISILKLFETFQKRIDSINNKIVLVLLFILTAFYFTVTGIYFTKTSGAHSGDEGHYIIQAQSIYQDFDLDINNNLGNLPKKHKASKHISPLSRNRHWYSWHPFGLSILIAPSEAGGIILRHIFLGIIAGLGIATMFILCKNLNASLSSTLIILGILIFSTVWGIYSSRCLPEIPAAALAALLLLSITTYCKKPVISLLTGIISCCYLPWLHTRFIPLSLAGSIILIFTILKNAENRKKGIIHITVFAFASIFGGCIYLSVNLYMFGALTAYPVKKLFFSMPIGMWHVISSDRSISAIFPVFAWMLSALLWKTFKHNEIRTFSIISGILFSTVLLTACSTRWWHGGASLPGRFLVITIPFFIGLTANSYDKSDRITRWWLIFLGLISCFQFLIVLVLLPKLNKGFAGTLEHFGIVASLIDGLTVPFENYQEIWTQPFFIILITGTLSLFFMSKTRRITKIFIIICIFTAAITSGFNKNTRLNITRVKDFSSKLSKIKLENARIQSWRSGNPLAIFTFSNLFEGNEIASITTENTGSVVKGTLVSQPLLEINDWQQRGYRWTTIQKPFYTGSGKRLFRLQGHYKGNGCPVLCVREGSSTLFEVKLNPKQSGMIDESFLFNCYGSGDVYLLMRLENGKGFFKGKNIAWTPYIKTFKEKLGLNIPEETHLVSFKESR